MHCLHSSIAPITGINSCYRLLENCHQRDISASNVTPNATRNNRLLQESPLVMNLAVKCSFAESIFPTRSVNSRIRGFIAGDEDGEDLLHAIYDHVLDEPVPERLRALLKP